MVKNINKRGLLYKRPSIKKFQFGSTFDSKSFSYSSGDVADAFKDSSLFGNSIYIGGKDSKPTQKNYFKEAKEFSPEPIKTPEIPKNIPKVLGYGQSIISPSYNGFDSWKPGQLKPLESHLKPTTLLQGPEYTTTKPAAPGRDLSGPLNAAGSLATMAGVALSNISDNKDNTFTGKEKFGKISGSILKGAGTGISTAGTLAAAGAAVAPITTAALTTAGAAATGAAMGSVVPLIGTAVGLVVGAIVGIIGSKKAKRQAADAQRTMDITAKSRLAAINRKANADRDTQLATGVLPTSYSLTEEQPGYRTARLGGTFHFTLKNTIPSNPMPDVVPMAVFKKGGKIKPTENIIPNGVLHEEENALGDKGMPVVKCTKDKCQKKYEIERDEMIFTLDTTKAVEELAKKGKLKELGAYVKEQVLNNTHSFTDKFNDLNNYTQDKNGTIYS